MSADRDAAELLNGFILRDRRLGDNPGIVAGVLMFKPEFDGQGRTIFSNNGTSTGTFPRIPRPTPGLDVVVWMHAVGVDRNLTPPAVVASASRSSELPPMAASNIGISFWGEGRSTAFLYACDLHKGGFSKDEIGQIQFLAALLELIYGGPRSRQTAERAGAMMRAARERLGMSQELLAGRISQNRITVSRWEGGAQIPGHNALKEWSRALGLVADAGTALVTVVEITPRLLQILRKDSDSIYRLTPSQFENLVANRLDEMGYDVALTGGTNKSDGGIDLIAAPRIRTVGSFVLAAQIKHHADQHWKTGSEAVQKLLAWKDSPFRMGLLVTNTAFTSHAIWVANQERNRHFLRLRDLEDLRRWLQDNFGDEKDWREIPDRITLAPGIEVEVPKPKLQFGWNRQG